MNKNKCQPSIRTVTRTLVPRLGLVVALVLTLAAVDASAQNVRRFVLEGIPSTGPYIRCGEPLFAVPPPFPPEGFGNGVGIFDPHPDATDALPLTPDKCDDKDLLLATTTSVAFNNFFGNPPPNPKLLNIPLRLVPVMNGFDSVYEQIPLMGAFPPNAFPVPHSKPDFAITLGVWFGVRGRMVIQCFANGTAHVEGTFLKAIPHGIYSINGAWVSPTRGIVLSPFGGNPNFVVADSKGTARFVRDLNYCPKDKAPDNSVLVFLTFFYHSDGGATGSTPFRSVDTVLFRDEDGTTFTSTTQPGTVRHVQMNIPVNVVVLPNAAQLP